MTSTADTERVRCARLARRSALIALFALLAFLGCLLLVHGPLRQVAGALIGVCIVTIVGAQVVFFWALLRGRLYRRAPQRAD